MSQVYIPVYVFFYIYHVYIGVVGVSEMTAESINAASVNVTSGSFDTLTSSSASLGAISGGTMDDVVIGGM